ncbi:thiol-disulfide isomerase/thioredoxin [Dyadobacter sp. BE34]|uniref:Thiol-disulfide isomerase/thioredoxin n=1 Tax=Dyadobacter fermentans TaxID=94254 RepID=A0ABU1R200_9BACT|nr:MULTISPECIES: redoxin family protein [Dyadobacter]MDR6806560.1 thiol-disulfide isomerase/thioredoxin [Dyadobacter fermentans]MDR7044301.1 thiol-disulfide isomerase/thioredoxin [Dyadobacter sp. BE242]MDR7198612.1 thiol-disulfide isomerase/thioredoxin [Dyadobacter sp. BE34]MDR7216574.1 thiol-disulfide isomerase/thioredoxin [Dyadobacter sp. BE31]MDR7263900.1 thiol-disulfide isomerase/thioredoxin [Dyadobacter sp. BE32]
MRLFFLGAALAAFTTAHAQMTVSGKISSTQPAKALVFNVPFDCWQNAANSVEVVPDRKGKFSIRLPVEKPQIIFLIYAGKRLQLYAEPGKTLVMETDDSLKTLKFGGSVGKENQFRRQLGLTTYNLGEQTWNDTLSAPEQILTDLGQARQSALLLLKTSRLSASFVRMTKADIQYYAVSKLWDLVWKNGVWTSDNKSKYGQNEWRRTLKAAHEAVALSNANALDSYHYQIMVSYYPRYLQHLASNKDEFTRIAEAVFKKSFVEINQLVRQKGERYWEYTALQYGFKGRVLEYAMASFLINGIDQGNLEYQQEAYQDFAERFPESPYMPDVRKKMKPFLASLVKTEAELADIRFVPNSPDIPTLDSLVSGYKGRVVFIDIWGTWCGPCRQEFSFNQALKDRFKGKSVEFAYIAVEHRPNPEKSWREMIAFYQLAGSHILAGKALVEDLRKIYVQQGNLTFPSYILVDKSGKIVTIHAKRPSDREALYKQIEQLL